MNELTNINSNKTRQLNLDSKETLVTTVATISNEICEATSKDTFEDSKSSEDELITYSYSHCALSKKDSSKSGKKLTSDNDMSSSSTDASQSIKYFNIIVHRLPGKLVYIFGP